MNILRQFWKFYVAGWLEIKRLVWKMIGFLLGKYLDRKAARRDARIVIHLESMQLSPSELERIRRRLTEDAWTERRNKR